MSTLKSILHHWDSSSSSYDTLHPQTESGAITDWHESVIGSLASEVLPTVVSELTTDSVLGKLMKMLLNASGVKYSIGTNGYVCLGSFFGGLIIQWGTSSSDPGSGGAVFNYPLSMSAAYNALACLSEYPSGDTSAVYINQIKNNLCYCDVQRTQNSLWHYQ